MAENNGNNYERENVNTSAVTFTNTGSEIKSALNISYWNQFVSLRINFLTPPDENGTQRIDRDKHISTALSIENVQFVIDMITEHINPAIEAGTDCFYGSPVGSNGTSMFGVGTKKQNGESVPYFAIFKNIDPQTRLPETFMLYFFKKKSHIVNYNPEDGSFVTEDRQVELKVFTEILRAAVIGLSNAVVHSDRLVNRAYKNKLMEVAGGNSGGGNRSGGNGNGYYNRQRSGSVFSDNGNSGGGRQQQSQRTESAQTTTANSYDDLNPDYYED